MTFERPVGVTAPEHPAAPHPRSRRSRRTTLGYFLLLPTMAVIGLLTLYPMITTLFQSFFHESSLASDHDFIGLKNYRGILDDPSFTQSLRTTVIYVVIGVVLLVGGGLVVALTLRRGFRGRPLVIAVLILPWALPGIVEGLIWAWLYDPTYGVVNSVLVKLHLISGPAILVGQHRLLSVLLIELVQVWQLIPLTTLMILASMQAIPDDIYEASDLDGAGPLKQFFSITLPLIRPGLTIATVESLVSAVTIFDISYALTGGTGATETNPVMAEIYNVAFTNQNFGQAYAGVFIVTAGVMVVSAIVMRLLYRATEF
jgi:multiple sugar transport system permease protein